MTGVIYDALRPHQYPTAPTPALLGCSGCAWTHPCARPDGPFTVHLAEVATAAVLEVTERVLAEHYPIQLVHRAICAAEGCGWEWAGYASTPSDRLEALNPAEHLQAVIAAALAGDG